ncbi:MAG: hypothetical protein BGN88_01525 [Clostridiales bacterium 43-6]|nr:MAG: hypothetical protein BGN88_01525 [Clostridiales bacterium 43-6]
MFKKSKKLIVLSFTLVFLMIFSSVAYADQPTDTGSGTIDGTPDKYVEVVMDDSTINFGTLNISQQEIANSRTDANGKYVIFESQYDLTPGQSIDFNEGASNSNIFVKATYTGQTYPVGGLTSTSWLFFKDTAATGYIQSQVTGTLTAGGAGAVTLPAGVTEGGSYSTAFVYYTTADAGVTWSRNSKTIYVALGDNARLYVGDALDLSTADYYSEKGDAVDTPFYGNNMTESSTFPTAVGQTATLDFGYYIPWDATQGNAAQSFYALIDLPMHAAYDHNWTWNLTLTGEFKSAV